MFYVKKENECTSGRTNRYGAVNELVQYKPVDHRAMGTISKYITAMEQLYL